MADHVPCPWCRGTGKFAVTGVYADTLALLRKQSCEVTGAVLAYAAGCKATTMNNRLSALERHGLATSRRYGVKRLYKATRRKK